MPKVSAINSLRAEIVRLREDNERLRACAEDSELGGWVIFDATASVRIRGPYKHAETAVAVRREFEYFTDTDHNLQIYQDAALLAALSAEEGT